MSENDRSLEEKFLDVDGVGEKTTEELLDIVNGHQFEYPAYVEKAMDAVRAGDDRNALVYLGRAARDRDSDR